MDDVANFYNNMAAQFKEGWKACHWNSKESQEDNFTLLTQIAPFEQNDRILDLGCGQGDLYGFIKKMGWKVIYEGIDFSNKMIDRAWNNHPQGRFACVDFLDDSFNYQYDWILASGSFNNKVDNNYMYLDKCLNKMYRLSKKGFGTILLSEYDPNKKSEYLFSYNPIKVMEICMKSTYTINMNHTALPWGFVIFVYNKEWINAPIEDPNRS